jgi:hypothetical protein
VPLDLAQGKPYQWVREYIPGFAQLRSPFRFAMLVQLHLALLAGFGLYNLSRWFRSSKNWLPIGIAALAIFEALALPLPLQAMPELQKETLWQAWLNKQSVDSLGAMHFESFDSAPFGSAEPTKSQGEAKRSGQRGQAPYGQDRQDKSALYPKIVILPFAKSSKVEDFEQTTLWMLAGHSFRGAMLNGYSGFFPPDHGRVRDKMLQFPTAESIQLLQQKEIDYVVVYHGLAKAPSPEAIEKYLSLVYRDEGENVAIYALRK